jgi:hypothetical protein
MNRQPTTSVGVLVLALGVLCASATGQNSLIFLVDFEDLAEETEISDQYIDLGVTFSIDGDPTALPIISVEGSPTTAFTGSGADKPMSSGTGGLTDPLVGGSPSVPQDIAMAFDPPVSSVRLFVIDIDGSDTATMRAFNNGMEVGSMTKSAGDPGTGNGVSTELLVSAETITDVVVEMSGSTTIGYAIDFLLFTRPCQGAECGPQVRIAQESAPGLGDFEQNILGFLLAYPTTQTAAEFYQYGIPEGSSWNGPWLTPIVDRSHLLLGNTSEGVTLFIIHDRAIPNDPDGGEAEMSIELFDDDGAERTVEDDASSPDFYTGEPGETLFTSDHSWSPCCTDGVAISGLDCLSTTIVQFTEVDGNPSTPVIEGMTEWVAYSADGTEIPLALEADRRVRLEVIPAPGCPADLNCDGIVNVPDLLLVLAAWGETGVLEDINQDGVVDVEDLLQLLSAWGPCT